MKSGSNRFQTRFAAAFLLFCFSALAHAGSVNLEWDAVVDERVDHYEVAYGASSGKYDANLVLTGTSVSVSGLSAGSTYYLAVRACDKLKVYCSEYSNEVVAQIPSLGPKADFTASVVSGVAPLTVTFVDQSEGQVSSVSWDFGDGATSRASTAVHTYTVAGTYTVKLKATGAGGSSQEIKSSLIKVTAPVVSDNGSGSDDSAGSDNGFDDAMASLPLETGEVEVDSDWSWVSFRRTFIDPVVIVKGISANDADPAVIRIENVSPDGFSMRVQEWGYLDGVHDPETVTYLVMERGRHQLPNGVWVEAGSVETNVTKAFQYQSFSSAFGSAPVVFASVVTFTGKQAVAARLKDIDSRGFYIGMREEEANDQVHWPERLDYIAWEPSSGVIDGLKYEVGTTDNAVTDSVYELPFGVTFDNAPMFVADMQTTDGGDTAGVRWTGFEAEFVDLWVQEEQSRDAEMAHTTEVVGYFAAEIQE
ncbi:PKD domain-containing protein [Thiorhodococcus fuscus]|uniref:PKD domain-containing protein n=1 Tax=Thiorhodococcus fuscus TaxID=527200 RepID=A0ABW4Y6S8_9GAMM